MIQNISRFCALALLPATCLLADFSYEQTTKITGGAMAGMIKFAGTFSKQLREPMRSTVVVKGDRMAHISQQRATIIDLSKETITEVDYQKKTYSQMTFAEMTQMLQEAAQKSKEGQAADVNFKVDVKDTGQTKQVGGFDTKEVILKIIMEMQDQKDPSKKASMVMTTDSWMAPKVAGYDEINEFHQRMAQKLAWTPGGSMMTMGRQDMAKAMAEAMKEGAKLNGMPVLQVIRMGMDGMPAQGGAAQGQQQQPQTAEKPSVGGALGGALGGRLGRLGGFGRKKKEEPPPEQAQQQPAQQEQAPAAQGQSAEAAGALMEMTSELSGFSAAAVDPSKLEVPAGFKQVQPERRAR